MTLRTVRGSRLARLTAISTAATALAVTVVSIAPPWNVGTAAPPYPTPVMTGYVPLDSDATQLTMESATTLADTTLDFTVGITNAGPGAVMFYDHWEDGYEADITNPTQSTTEVWGDGDNTGGNAQTYCGVRCAGDLLPAGAVFVLRNSITTPRVSTQIRWDGRDRVSSTRGFTITAGGFSTPLGSVLSASASAYDTSKWGTDYWIPIGEDMTPPFLGTSTTNRISDAFSTTSIQIMADQPGTVVNVDKNGDGTIDVTQTIGAGGVMFVNEGVNRGARVRSSKPVQVHVGSGDKGAQYELRWFTLFPTALLTADYLNPVGSSSDNQRTITYLFNPNTAAITVTPTCTGCSGTLTVPALGGAKFASPVSQAVRFQNLGGQPFVAVGAAGAESGALPGSGTDNSATYDWGFGLVPTRFLTAKAVLGWAPGNSNNPPAAPAGNRDDDPIWISALGNTTLYVDFDGDPTTGSLAPITPANPLCTGRYDQAISVTQGTSTRIYDSVDGDMTGASIYTCDGTLIAGAWGEDPANAPSGAPGFDAGYALIPSTAMLVNKTSALGTDTNGDGRFGPGDIVQYDISIADTGALSFTNLEISDALPAGTAYVPGSATYDEGDGINDPFADDVPPSTPYPFDESGTALPTIAPGTTVHVRYRVRILNPFPAGTTIVNVIDVGADQADGGDTDVIDLVTADLSLAKVVQIAPTYLGEDATFRLTVSNAGPDAAEGVQVRDILPTGLTFVSSATAAGSYDQSTGIWSAGTVAVGTSVTLDIVARVDSLSVTNNAEISGSLAVDPDSTPGNGSITEDDDASASLTVLPAADVSLTKQRTAGPDADGNTTFLLTVVNSGPAPSGGVQVTDHPPTGAVFVSGTPVTNAGADGTFDGNSGVWTVPNLASGGQAQMTVVYNTSAGPGTNYAQVTASSVYDPDSQPETTPLSDTNLPDQDDEASAVAPAVSDVYVTNVVTTGPTYAGDTVVFTVTVGNDGPNGTTGVNVTDLLPAGLAYVSSVRSVGSYNPTTGVWNVGDLPSGQVQTLVITAVVTAPGPLTTTAELTSSTVPDIDSTPNNGIAAEDDQASVGVATTGMSMGDTVWLDLDNDFVVDAGEPGLPGLQVTATWFGPNGLDDGGTGDDVAYTTTTDAIGNWSLTGLPAGGYIVTVDDSALPFGATTPTNDRDGAATPSESTLTLVGGIDLTDVDFAYAGSGVIGDTIFFDRNDDGLVGAGEGIEGVTVHLVWFGPGGALGGTDDVPYTTVTDEFGVYSFDNLPAGNFAVAVAAGTLPIGLVNSVDPVGPLDNTAPISLAIGEERDDVDFGYAGTNSIGDTVFADIDGDGIQDPGEIGLGGVVLTLLVDADANGSFETTWATTVTSDSGTYVFDKLPAGRYQVVATTPPGLTPTTPMNVAVVLTDGQTVTTADFGLQPPPPGAPGSIGDLVWNDADGDGIFDAGESGVAGAIVTLRQDVDGDGIYETVVATQASGPSGSYLFDNLPEGTYQVSIAPPAGFFQTTVTAYPVTVTAGVDVDTADFGLAATPQNTASIGDFVWNDLDRDGVQDGGETGVSGVTITLRQDTDGDGIFETVADTTTTAGDGSYLFIGLPPGSYRVVAATPLGQFPTTPSTFDVGAAVGAAVTTADFGLADTTAIPGTIGDRIWLDANRDGIQDPGEPGANDVTVTLLADLDGDGVYETVLDTTTTAADGNYLFVNVPPGSYIVVATPPAGLVVATPAAPIALLPGANIDTADIGLAVGAPTPFDLQIVKTADGTGTTGSNIIWTLAVTNNSTSATPADVQVVDVLPAGLTYVSATGPGWACAAAGQTVTCDHAAALAGSASSSITLTTTITAAGPSSITNAATVSAGGGELTTTNNASSAVIVVAPTPTTTPTTTTTIASTPTDTTPVAATTTAVGSNPTIPISTVTPLVTPTTVLLSNLPSTGGNAGGLLRIAGLLLALGVALVLVVWVTRRRAAE